MTVQLILFRSSVKQGAERSYIFEVKRLVTSPKVADWCRMPYPGHAKGCPNYDDPTKPWCPPRAPAVGEFFDLSRGLYLVHSEYDLEARSAELKSNNPDWTDKQCRCVLYWQKTSRKQLRLRAAVAMKETSATAMTTCPEAMGVNVYATAALSGLKLEKIDGLRICRHVALIGFENTKRKI